MSEEKQIINSSPNPKDDSLNVLLTALINLAKSHPVWTFTLEHNWRLQIQL